MKTLKLLFPFLFCLLLINAHAQIIHVPGDYPTIQEGIDAAQFFSDTVLVDEGTYYENISFSGKFITVASHFILSGDSSDIYNTIIDGSQPTNPDLGSVVYFNNGEDTNSVISGFTIQGGTGSHAATVDIIGGAGILVENCGAKITHNRIINNNINTVLGAAGAGIGAGDAYNNKYVVIRNNQISNNSINSHGIAEGGGIELFCNGIIENNQIINNEITSENDIAIGAGVRCVGFYDTRNIRVVNNTISGNILISGSMVLYGGAGGIQAYACDGIISNNTIQFNETAGPISSIAGGMHFGYCGPALTVSNNLISYNKSNYETTDGLGGGIYLSESSVVFINNRITSNYADYGAGVYNHLNKEGGGPTQFINNTIADNEGDGDGTAIYLEDADAIVLNSILWNDGNEIYVSGGNIEVAYSNILDTWTGVGNINVDPVFLDPEYHLAWPSQCIGAGTESIEMGGVTYNCPATDFEGEPRPQCVLVDIGADESPFWVGITEKAEQENNLKTTPNPTSGIININYEIQDRGEASLSILNMSGEFVEAYIPARQIPGEQNLQLDLTHLPNGLYLIRLLSGERVETAKIVILK